MTPELHKLLCEGWTPETIAQAQIDVARRFAERRHERWSVVLALLSHDGYIVLKDGRDWRIVLKDAEGWRGTPKGT